MCLKPKRKCGHRGRPMSRVRIGEPGKYNFREETKFGRRGIILGTRELAYAGMENVRDPKTTMGRQIESTEKYHINE